MAIAQSRYKRHSIACCELREWQPYLAAAVFNQQKLALGIHDRFMNRFTSVEICAGTGEQDRVGVAEIARDKVYRKLADWISWEKYATHYNDLVIKFGIREGITAIIQPGGSLHDWDVIDCCNDAHVAMVFTGQHSFRH
ncbi:MAG: hypothetical protein WCH61_05310 [bacterium]